MTESTAKVGDIVFLPHLPHYGSGILRKSFSGEYFVEFFQYNLYLHNGDGNGKSGHCWFTTRFELVSPTIKLTKEEKLHLKCKTLWNNSKYVKKNPSFAY